MNFTFVMAVYNNLDLTLNCYNRIRKLYPNIQIIISSGGSYDDTKNVIGSIQDNNLTFIHVDNKISFSETYNNGIKEVKTEKLVLIHNDMVIGEHFIENLDKLLTEKMILSYTTVEPPIFAGHIRPGKVIQDFGDSFDNFNEKLFNKYVESNKDKYELYDGSVFFLSTYKKSFDDFGYFDGFSFNPCFCEDDDLLIRAKLKGYTLKTTECAITYHFVSKTSRFSKDFINIRHQIELNSNRNFVRKWGLPISTFHEMKYWLIDNFKYDNFKMGLLINDKIDINLIGNIEPFFDLIECSSNLLSHIDSEYITKEQTKTNYSLKDKFQTIETCDVVISFDNFTNEDLYILYRLRLVLSEYNSGKYKSGNLVISID